MASNKAINITPVALVLTTPTNIVSPGSGITSPVGFASTAPYIILRHIRILNKTGTAATFSLYKGGTGASAAGTEVIGTGQSVAANSAYDWYGMMRLDGADFLVGFANTATALTFQAEGEIGIS